MRPAGAPRLLERLLARWLGPDAAEAVLGDLEEERRLGGRPAAGPGAALHYWWHGLSIGLWARRRAPRPPVVGSPGLVERWTSIVRELGLAARALRRQPVFAAVVVVTLALAIGANTALYAVVDAVLLRPLPWDGSDRLVRLYEVDGTHGGRRDFASIPTWHDWVDGAAGLASAAAWWTPELTLGGRGEPERVLGALTSASLFEVLRVSPALGRVYGAEEDRPGGPGVVVLGDGLWRRRFGGDPDVLGRTLTLDGRPATVIGVMPPGFGFPTPRTELYLPLQRPRERGPVMGTPWRGYRIVSVVGRLAHGASLESARAELEAVSRDIERAHPDTNAGWGVEVRPLLDDRVGEVRPGLLALLGAVALVLFVACANVSGVMLARLRSRSRELAIRAALGASRARLIRPMLLETLLLAALGGAAGVALGAAGLRVLVAVRPEGLPRVESIALDGRVLAFALSASLVAALASGLVPALRAASVDPEGALRLGSPGAGGGPDGARARRALVVLELAVTLTLLVGAALLGRSLTRLLAIDPGFSAAGVDAVALVQLPRSRYQDPVRVGDFYAELLADLLAAPGVEAAGLSLGVPLDREAGFFVAHTPFRIPEAGDSAPRSSAPLHVVSPGFFEALRVPLVRGRLFDDRDRRGRPGVALVNEAFARRHLPGLDPVGRRLVHELVLTPGEPRDREIVGVVGDVRFDALERSAPPQIYLPYAQTPWTAAHVLVRGTGGPPALAAALRRAVGHADDAVAVSAPVPLSAIAAAAVSAPRLRAELLGGFGALALLLAALGLYGLLASGVAARVREIGVRVAVGAGRGQVVGMIVREGMALVALGILLGLSAAAALARLLSGLVYGVTLADPLAWLGAPVVLVAVAWLACAIPARRAAELDAMRALRGE